MYLVIFNWELIFGWSYSMENLGTIKWSCFCQESIHICFSQVSSCTSNLRPPYLSPGSPPASYQRQCWCRHLSSEVSAGLISARYGARELRGFSTFWKSILVICSDYSESHIAGAGWWFTFFKDYTCCSMENRLQGQGGCWANSEGPLSALQVGNDGGMTQSGGSKNNPKGVNPS